MQMTCAFEGTVPNINTLCHNCNLFMETCMPIATADGYALGSELDCYLCYGCHHECAYGNL